MPDSRATGMDRSHGHVFLAPSHEKNERRAWAVIILCGLMMIGEIVRGLFDQHRKYRARYSTHEWSASR